MRVPSCMWDASWHTKTLTQHHIALAIGKQLDSTGICDSTGSTTPIVYALLFFFQVRLRSTSHRSREGSKPSRDRVIATPPPTTGVVFVTRTAQLARAASAQELPQQLWPDIRCSHCRKLPQNFLGVSSKLPRFFLATFLAKMCELHDTFDKPYKNFLAVSSHFH